MDEVSSVDRFAAEFTRARAELGESNENGDLSEEEVVAQATKIALQRMGQTKITDLSEDGDALSQNANYENSGSTSATNKLDGLNGFEIAKRIRNRNELGEDLLAKVSNPGRLSFGGGASSLLKAGEFDFRKMDEGDDDLSTSRKIDSPEDLTKRLSARNAAGVRKIADASILDFPGRTISRFIQSRLPAR